MVSCNISVGDVVKSVSGRTKDHLFVVVADNERFAFLSDGKRWPVSRPKKKNKKHIKSMGVRVETLSDERIQFFLRELSRGGND
jgi:ribosomal protein L14E/L6E/L27E